MISVRDTGPGLSSEDIPRAFDRFFLFDRYRGERPVGTGLGLAIVKDQTEAMGGSVSVRSEVGVGSVFTVRLRLDDGPGGAATGRKGAPQTGWEPALPDLPPPPAAEVGDLR